MGGGVFSLMVDEYSFLEIRKNEVSLHESIIRDLLCTNQIKTKILKHNRLDYRKVRRRKKNIYI